MQAKTLKQPGRFSNADRLRHEVATAISHVETAKAKGATGEGALLSAFLSDAAAKTPNATIPTVPATQVVLSSGQKVNAVSVTGTGNFATFTIAGGAITAIVLSAS